MRGFEEDLGDVLVDDESLVCRGHNCLSCFIGSVLGVSIGRPLSHTYFLDNHVLLQQSVESKAI